MYSITNINIYFANDSLLQLDIEKDNCKYFTTEYKGNFFVIGFYQKDGAMEEKAFPSDTIDRISIIRKFDKQRTRR